MVGKILVSFAKEDEFRSLLTRLTDRLHTDKRFRVSVLPATHHVYDAQLVHALEACDYFVPVVTEYSDDVFRDRSVWAPYVKHLSPMIERVVPVQIDSVAVPLGLWGLASVDIRRSFEAGYDQLVEIIASARGSLITTLDRRDFPAIAQITEDFFEKLVTYFAAHPEELRTIDRRRFEELVAQIFREFKYEVELTARTRDGGRDVIAIKREEVNVRFLIECKRPNPGKPVGVAPVRALLGVTTNERATKGILATTAHFTSGAKALFEQHRWELEARDYDGLTAWLKKLRGT
jgi:hypothetical protein